MSSSLEFVLEDVAGRLPAGLDRDDAAAIVTALALMTLSDEVCTVSERQALCEVLARRWALQIAPDSVPGVLERVAVWPRHLLLRHVETQCQTWPIERVRELMGGLLDIVGADGHVAWGERALLQRLAEALAWTEIPPPTSLRRDSTVLSRVALIEGESLRVGRSLQAEVCLTRAPIAPLQVSVTLSEGRLTFRDIGVRPAVVVSGRIVEKGDLSPGEDLSIGRYRIRLEPNGNELAVIYPGFAATLIADDLATTVRQDGHLRTLLDGISFCVTAGEMVAIIGPSGAGKSTLLHVLRGDIRTSRGYASLDDVRLEPGRGAATRRISFVPQEELLLAALTVQETVSYAARLKGLNASYRGLANSLVDEMLERVGLADHNIRRTMVGDAVNRGLSGGQCRRVSVAQELVGDDTDVLLLDEPTSGLDPRSEVGITALMRDLADGGRIVIAATHAVHADELTVFDKVICLTSRGRLAYYGPPAALLEHFEAQVIAEVFERLDVSSAAAAPARDPGLGAAQSDRVAARVGGAPPILGFRGQLAILLRREVRTRLRDPASLSLALGLPVAVAGLCSLVYFPGCVQPMLLFVLCLAGLWSGVSFTVRDIISHFALIRHESRTRAALGSSYLAKVIVATGVSATQSALLAGSLFVLFGAHNAAGNHLWPKMLYYVSVMSPAFVFLVLWSCHLFGNAVGFLLSACFRTAEAAIFMIPFVVLPMVALSGALVSPASLPTRLVPIVRAAPLYQGYVGLLGSTASVCLPLRGGLDSGVTNKSTMCDLAHRTVPSPEDGPRYAAFVQPASSCLNYTYQDAESFCRNNDLPVPLNVGSDSTQADDASEQPISASELVRSQLNPRIVARSVGLLVAMALVLHIVAFQTSRRRMRTL